MTDPKKRTEDFLYRAEREMGRIEIQQDLKGLQKDGTIKNEKENVSRSEFSNARKISIFTLEEGVEFASFSQLKEYEDLTWEMVKNKSAVDSGAFIACCEWTEEREELFSSQEYQEKFRIKAYKKEESICFETLARGVPVIVNERIFVFPADAPGSLFIEISQDYMEAMCTIFPPRGEGEPIYLGDVTSALEKKGVICGYSAERLNEQLEYLELRPEKYGESFLCAQGIQPVIGKDGYIKTFFAKPEESEFTVDENGRIDYKKYASILMAEKGMLLAELVEPTEGSKGQNLKGEELPAESGKELTVCCGKNVVRKENKFFAEMDGLIVFVQNNLSVLPHYLVPGDVDMGCGNIRFNGCVTVQGNVLSGFHINASGDIVIQGNVEGAALKAGRDIRIGGGLIGDVAGKAIIECGRHLVVGYVQNAYIKSQGDVLIKASAMHSRIFSSGVIQLDNSKGRLVGGHACALKRIYAAQIGSSMGTKTKLEAGRDFLFQEVSKQIEKACDFCIQSMKKLEVFLKPLLPKMKAGELSSEQKARVNLIVAKHKELNSLLEQYKARREYLSRVSSSCDEADILVEKIIYPDVALHIASGQKLNDKTEKHCRFFYDGQSEKIKKEGFRKVPLPN
jgi:uncharacterized protein (DUF342 family)